MKFYLFLTTIFALVIACSNDKPAQTNNVAQNGTPTELLSKTEASQTPDAGITGYWKLTVEAYDNNENKILDDDERKKGIKNRYSFRFNADGSCQIVESFKGHYELKTEGGKKMLYVYRNRVEGQEKQDPVPDVYRIISLSENALVLLEREGNLVFWVFERVK
jgi:hypothetical protein